MHYITGTEIKLNPQARTAIKPGMSSAQVRAHKSAKIPEEFKDFEPGVTYTLIRIRPDGDNVIYTFDNNMGARVEIKFNSITVAENLISRARGEQVPDYRSAYNRTD